MIVGCLSGANTSMEGCNDWGNPNNPDSYLKDEARETLLKLAEASLQLQNPSQETRAQHGARGSQKASKCVNDTSHGTCFDPSTFDLSNYDCDCFDFVKNATEEELHTQACGKPDVCCDWYESHCGDEQER